ncbi:hypothetical protein BC628DRAFT_1399031 [Trametes gibbosa]|uniref:C2H2-type domain-containing protein n=1 Tax=Trametes gibbosa TaxID=160864 RepID=A0A6G6FQB0_9APHY|nr:hypothetical protein BC628DRAFT_1399031 [Trametes gibbosa]QIE48424.1 hypothetical protein [Trametes gibbosa]
MAYCERCERWFSSERALEQHKDDSSRHYVCHECAKDFASSNALQQHLIQSPRHPSCRQCSTLFDEWSELYEHYNEDHHYCDPCNTIFASEQALHDHRRQRHGDRYCTLCRRIFQNANSFAHHCRSARHQGRSVDCPMRGCEKSFVSNAGLLLHLESGGCVSHMTREKVDRIMSRYDKQNLITKPDRLIGGGTGTTVIGQWATERAWNGSHYECYLCHRTYATLPALNQHLSSPAHAEKRYHCPSALYGCGAEFRTLSGFCQHVESDQCGVRRFRGEVDRVLDGLSSKMKRLTMG